METKKKNEPDRYMDDFGHLRVEQRGGTINVIDTRDGSLVYMIDSSIGKADSIFEMLEHIAGEISIINEDTYKISLTEQKTECEAGL